MRKSARPGSGRHTKTSFGRSLIPKNSYSITNLRQHFKHVRNHPRARFLIRALALSFLCSPFCLRAQLPVARLFTIFPPGGKAGSSVEVEVAGQDVEAAHELHFSDRRITARHLDGAKFKVSIPPGLEPF